MPKEKSSATSARPKKSTAVTNGAAGGQRGSKAAAAKAAATPAPVVEPAPAPEPEKPAAPAIEITTYKPKSATSAPRPAPAPEPAPVIVPPSTPPPALVAQEPEEPIDPKLIIMKPPIVVKDLAARMNLKNFHLVHDLMEMQVFVDAKQAIDEEVARKVCEKRGYRLELEKREKGGGQVHAAPKVVEPPKPEPPPSTLLEPRPPVITFMGHVDHGKTSLLDAIRKARVAAGEAGGITQHIGAYSVVHNGQSITFLDTPGHEAFTAMRARGATITDIVVIVVAADDGLMPQTIEAINHAKAAKVTIMVAINKIDLPGANLQRIKGQLQEYDLQPEEYGGQTIVTEVSATKNIGIDKLLELMLLQAELMELKASRKGTARGTIIESQFEQGRGPTASVLVRSGTLKVGDSIIAGSSYGRVKALIDDLGKNVKEATPSMPVKVMGLSIAPSPGEELTVMKNEREARDLAEERHTKARTTKLSSGPRITLESMFASIAAGDRKVMKIVLKADVQGSVEAIVNSLKKIESKKIDLEIVHSAVGPISESDILLAKASQAMVIGFNTKTDNAAANAARREEVQIKLYSIIYELIDQVKEAMVGLLDPELRETQVGTAIVKQVIKLSKYPVAGCEVKSGRLMRNGHARVVRRKQPIYDGAIVTLKRFQDDVAEVRSGLECGCRLGEFSEYQVDDVIECYQLEKVPQTL